MKNSDDQDGNQEARQAWDANARFWDERMGDGTTSWYSGGTTPLSWSGKFSEIPPVLVARMRRAG